MQATYVQDIDGHLKDVLRMTGMCDDHTLVLACVAVVPAASPHFAEAG